jgi:transposase
MRNPATEQFVPIADKQADAGVFHPDMGCYIGGEGVMESTVFVGVDVSKDWLDIARSDQRKTQRIEHTRAALKSWLGSVPPGSRMAVESTGKLHQLLVRCAMAAGHIVYVLNAHDLSYYARSLGRRAKTDRLDAQLILRYLVREHEELHAYVEPSAQQRQFDELLRQRHTVVVKRESLRQCFSGTQLKLRELKAALRGLDQLVAGIERQLAALIAQDPQLSQRARQLRTVVGFGALLSTALAHALTRRTYRNADAFIASVGYDPRPRDSGQKTGRRYLSKRGPAQLRRVLFMAAMSAAKTKLWRPFYHRQRAKGLSSTAALVILARKLARIAYSIVKHDTAFNPERVKSACACP